MLKAQDELFAELSIEYDDYLRKSEELKLENSAEYKAIVDNQRENIKNIIMSNAPADNQESEKTDSEKKNDWLNSLPS